MNHEQLCNSTMAFIASHVHQQVQIPLSQRSKYACVYLWERWRETDIRVISVVVQANILVLYIHVCWKPPVLCSHILCASFLQFFITCYFFYDHEEHQCVSELRSSKNIWIILVEWCHTLSLFDIYKNCLLIYGINQNYGILSL